MIAVAHAVAHGHDHCGISAIKAGTVLFGGSDAPLTAGEPSSAGLVQFPTCNGGVVPIVNLPGVGGKGIFVPAPGKDSRHSS